MHGPSVQRLPLKTLVALGIVGLVMLALGVLAADPIRHRWHQLTDPAHASPGDAASATHYTCGMHPWVILPAPGDCPICHMKLVPLEADRFTSTLTIAPAITQRIGVRTARVTRQQAAPTLSAVGSVVYDPTRLAQITLKYDGWVEKLHVAAAGEAVKQGQPLMEIYAPALYVSQQEYLTAFNRLRDNVSNQNTLLSAARRRLEYLDVTPQQITELEKRGSATKTLPVLSPIDGLVTELTVTQGQRVEEGQVLYRVADLSRVWIQTTLYENQLAAVTQGMAATITLPEQPGQSWEATVDYIYPWLDPATRQGSARLIVDNPNLTLKPGMFVNVQLQGASTEALVIPADAVLHTGSQTLVFLDQGQGQFHPQPITLGRRVGNGLVAVLQGLEENQSIVTSAQFLLDSEANTRQALAQLSSATDQPAEAKPAQDKSLTPQAAQHINTLLTHYLAMSEQLAKNDAALSANAGQFAQAITDAQANPPADDPHFWHRHMMIEKLRERAKAMTSDQPLDQARLRFQQLSQTMIDLLQATGVPANFPQPIHALECSMYRDNQPDRQGGWWVSPVDMVRNPYFGPMMLGCYTDESKLPVAAVTPSPEGAQP